MNPIFTDLAPNTEPDDVRCALQLFVRPWQWSRGEAVAKLEAQFRAYLPIAHSFAFASGRSCLYALLKSFGVSSGDEVLLQAYTCVAVPDPALWVGATPVYVDCEEDTFNMSAADLSLKITPRSKVLIIQHTFGLPADLDRLMTIAREHRLIVIEDCAHALGAQYKGKQVGTFSDAAFFSFGRDKVISSVFGGMAVTNNAAIAEKLRALQEEFRMPPRAWILQQLLHPIVTGTAKRGWNVAGIGKFILALAKYFHVLSKPVYRGEKKGGKPAFAERRMANALAALALHQMGKLERFITHRRQIAEYYPAHLKVKQIPSPLEGSKTGRAGAGPGEGGVRGNLILPSEPVDCLHGFLRYTIRTPHAIELRKAARAQGIFLGDWYGTPIAPNGVDYKAIGYRAGSCPTAERIAKESVNLPTGVHVSIHDAEKIVRVVCHPERSEGSRAERDSSLRSE